MNKKLLRQSLPPPPPDPPEKRPTHTFVEDEPDYDLDDVETIDHDDRYSSLRRGQNRHQRNSRSGQISSFSQFSRLPPVPERPSLENRELSPIPDIVAPTNPMLSSSPSGNFEDTLSSDHNDYKRYSKNPPQRRQEQIGRENEGEINNNKISKSKSELEQENELLREEISFRQLLANREEDARSKTMTEKPTHFSTPSIKQNGKSQQAQLSESSGSLNKKRSKIPTARSNYSEQQQIHSNNRSLSEGDLGTESVDERLETLLHLLGGGRNGSVVAPGGPDLVAGTPNDTLQYLSQLELVARKLKDQLMRQKQDEQIPSEPKLPYKGPQEESDC